MKAHEKIALTFGQHIVKKEWEAAYSLLSEGLRFSTSPRDLEQATLKMLGYTNEEVSEAEVVLEMEDWPEKETDDIAWVYVALSGSSISEAVTVVVMREKHSMAIKHLEWGRP